MKKIKVGIVGYGNLGKAVEKQIISDTRFELVCVFSRRQITSSLSEIKPMSDLEKYENKVDLLVLCGGSKDDLLVQTPELIKKFNVINTFDTHKKILGEFRKIDDLAKEYSKTALLCCGWDPGIFSVARIVSYAIAQKMPICFWGPGVSMGHSEAVRRINGVKYATQYTIPNRKAIELVKKKQRDLLMFSRLCYVVADKKYRENIKHEIVNMPNYFKGQPTKVKFISERVFLSKHTKMEHAGEVSVGFGDGNSIELSVKMKSNPEFTASIVLAYCVALKRFIDNNFFGALTPLDIPPNYLTEQSRADAIKMFC